MNTVSVRIYEYRPYNRLLFCILFRFQCHKPMKQGVLSLSQRPVFLIFVSEIGLYFMLDSNLLSFCTVVSDAYALEKPLCNVNGDRKYTCMV